MKDEIKESNIYDDETLNILEERPEEFIKSKTKGFTIEESMEQVKQALFNNRTNAPSGLPVCSTNK